jgi:prevent-host-death family protein
MENPTDPLTTQSVAELRKNLGPAIGQVQYGGGSIEITKNGKTAAYLISPELFDKLTQQAATETDPNA